MGREYLLPKFSVLLAVASVVAQSHAEGSIPRVAPNRVVVELSRPVTQLEFAQTCSEVGICLYSIPVFNTHSVLLAPGITPEQAIERLRRFPWVKQADFDYLGEPAYTPNDPLFPQQWDKHIVGAPEAWDVTKGSPNTIVAILDSGVMLDHEDLIGQFVAGWNVQDQNSNVYDDFWHGTRVTGVAAAVMDNAKGIAGMAPECRYMPVKVGKKVNGNFYSTVTDVAAGLVWATDNGARVCNVSLAMPGSSLLQNAVRYCLNNGVVVVAAAGNNNSDRVFVYPAAYTEVISVAASNVNDGRGWQSNYGNWISVAAPGQDLWSTGLAAPPGDYRNSTGTSFAAPLVAGEAGMIYGLLANPGEREPWLALAVREIIESNVVPKDWVRHGRVDVAAAVRNVFVELNGTVTLDAWSGDASGINLRLELREPGTQHVVEALNITLDSEGRYKASFRRSGTYDLVLSGGTWLRSGHSSVTMRRGRSSFDFVTVNGDVDQDNVVSLFDVNAVLQAFTRTGRRPEDLNGDGIVSLVDLGVVLVNFARAGF